VRARWHHTQRSTILESDASESTTFLRPCFCCQFSAHRKACSSTARSKRRRLLLRLPLYSRSKRSVKCLKRISKHYCSDRQVISCQMFSSWRAIAKPQQAGPGKRLNRLNRRELQTQRCTPEDASVTLNQFTENLRTPSGLMFLYRRNLTVTWLEQVWIPASHTLYVNLARPVVPVESV